SAGPVLLPSLDPFGRGSRILIDLLDVVAGNIKTTVERTVAVRRRRPGEEDDAVLVQAGRLGALRAGVRGVALEQIEEGTRRGPVDAGREERLRAETDRPVGDRRAAGNPRQICRRTGESAEVNDVAGL